MADPYPTHFRGAQFLEDIGILRFFGPSFRGYFVDVGANDGLYGSNSYLLEQNGWKGILVEPSPTLAELCRRNRPGSIVVNKAAVGDASIRSIAFHDYVPNSQGVRFDGLSRVSSASTYEDVVLAAGGGVHEIVVEAACLDEMLAQVDAPVPIDVLSIDVEGYELETLKGLSIDKYAPRLIIIEDNSFGSDNSIPDFLENFGYVPFHRTFVNVWYAPKADSPRTIAIRHSIITYLGFKELATRLKFDEHPGFAKEMRMMFEREGAVGRIKQWVYWLMPVWLIRSGLAITQFCRRMLSICVKR